MYDCFRPGKVWLDNNQKRIQAHGGSIIFVDGIYYWYGENKEGITGTATGEPCPYWHHGVRLYSSTDLYNWKDEGIIMKESSNKNNPFHPSNIMDRPHILYNKKTKKYVMYSKTSQSGFDTCSYAVCIADDIHEFKYSHSVRSHNMPVGDFDLFIKDDKAYIVYEKPHTSMILQQLTDDYLDIKDEFIEAIPEECPPFVKEAPAYFERNGRSYLLTSGTTGYYPNRSRVYDITDVHNWIDLGDPCVNDVKQNSFHSQFSSVFKVPGKDIYIGVGDRWLTDLVEDLPNMEDEFYKMFSGKKDALTQADLRLLTDDNTSEANYVFLPITFDEKGNPKIYYHRVWKL